MAGRPGARAGRTSEHARGLEVAEADADEGAARDPRVGRVRVVHELGDEHDANDGRAGDEEEAGQGAARADHVAEEAAHETDKGGEVSRARRAAGRG